MHTCYDNNNTRLKKGDAVMYIENGNESEGIVEDLLSGNEIVFSDENGSKIVNASDTFVLPF